MFCKISIICLSICDLHSVNCSNRISWLKTCLLQRHSIDQRFYSHRRGVRSVKAQKITHRYIRCVRYRFCPAVSFNLHFNCIALFKFIQIHINIQILCQIHMVSIITGNNIACLQTCLSCSRRFVYCHDLCRIIPDKAYNDHCKHKCQDKIKNRTGCNNGNSSPYRCRIKGSRNIFLRCIFPDHRTGAADWQQFQRVPGFSLLNTQKSRTHSKRKFSYTDSVQLCK